MSKEFTSAQEAAAMHGLATNVALTPLERLECALQALRFYEKEREAMEIPEELAQRVSVTDHGVVTQTDPETETPIECHLITFAVVHDGVEYALSLSSSPLVTADTQAVYDNLINLGTYGVLSKAGLL